MPEAKETFELKGTVKSYNASARYGFITPDDPDMDDVFVDKRCLKESGLRFLKRGKRVVCIAFMRDRGPKARRVKLQ